MNVVETKTVEIWPEGLLGSIRKRPISFEVDVLDEKDFEDGESVEVEFPDGQVFKVIIKNDCVGPTIYDPFGGAYRHAYITYSPNGVLVKTRIAGLKARRV